MSKYTSVIIYKTGSLTTYEQQNDAECYPKAPDPRLRRRMASICFHLPAEEVAGCRQGRHGNRIALQQVSAGMVRHRSAASLRADADGAWTDRRQTRSEEDFRQLSRIISVIHGDVRTMEQLWGFRFPASYEWYKRSLSVGPTASRHCLRGILIKLGTVSWEPLELVLSPVE